MSALKISASALDVEWQRLQVIASNLANMNTTRGPDGTLFQPLRLVSGSGASFSDLVATGVSAPSGVTVMGIEPTATAPRLAYDPDHPDADVNGFVAYPGVDHAGEMTLLIQTSRVYEANLAAFSIAQQMYNRALELGRGQ